MRTGTFSIATSLSACPSVPCLPWNRVRKVVTGSNLVHKFLVRSRGQSSRSPALKKFWHEIICLHL